MLNLRVCQLSVGKVGLVLKDPLTPLLTLRRTCAQASWGNGTFSVRPIAGLLCTPLCYVTCLLVYIILDLVCSCIDNLCCLLAVSSLVSFLVNPWR